MRLWGDSHKIRDSGAGAGANMGAGTAETEEWDGWDESLGGRHCVARRCGFGEKYWSVRFRNWSLRRPRRVQSVKGDNGAFAFCLLHFTFPCMNRHRERGHFRLEIQDRPQCA